ncbi:MAG TPA: hypothetical protein VKX46_03335, partial [Ktedonobacteraceae bacterium]|nr:hypothetical protein [Ktedonobacteraceae bacterium]
LGEAMVGLEEAALLHRQVRNPIPRSANGILTVGYDEGDGHPVFTLRGYPVPLTRQQQGERSLALSGGNPDPYPLTTTTIHLAGPELLLYKELPASDGDPTIYETHMMMEVDAEHPTVRVLGAADPATAARQAAEVGEILSDLDRRIRPQEVSLSAAAADVMQRAHAQILEAAATLLAASGGKRYSHPPKLVDRTAGKAPGTTVVVKSDDNGLVSIGYRGASVPYKLTLDVWPSGVINIRGLRTNRDDPTLNDPTLPPSLYETVKIDQEATGPTAVQFPQVSQTQETNMSAIPPEKTAAWCATTLTRLGDALAAHANSISSQPS